MNLGFLPTLGLKMVSEVSGADRAEKKRDRGGDCRATDSFIRHATDVMQNTRERP